MDREAILNGYKALKNHLEDGRSSRDISSFDSPAGLIASTPESIVETEESSNKKQFLVLVDDLLFHVVGTVGLKEHIRSSASTSYNFALPTYFILSVFGNPEQEDWKRFDPAQIYDLEKEILAAALQGVMLLTGEAVAQAGRYLDWVQEFQIFHKVPEEFQKESEFLLNFLRK